MSTGLYSIFRSNVNLVIGIPTVKRSKGSYITSTLQSIFENMDEDESLSCLAVLFIGDTDATLVSETISTVETLFGPQLQSGVNFINILCTIFLYECRLGSFFYLHVTREMLQKWRLYKKHAHITLMKLTPDVNYTNILCAAFLCKCFAQFFLVTV